MAGPICNLQSEYPSAVPLRTESKGQNDPKTDKNLKDDAHDIAALSLIRQLRNLGHSRARIHEMIDAQFGASIPQDIGVEELPEPIGAIQDRTSVPAALASIAEPNNALQYNSTSELLNVHNVIEEESCSPRAASPSSSWKTITA